MKYFAKNSTFLNELQYEIQIFFLYRKKGVFFFPPTSQIDLLTFEKSVQQEKHLSERCQKWFLNNNGEKNQIKKTRNIQKIFD